MLEDVGCEHDIDLLAGEIDDPAAHHADDEVEDDGEAQTDGEGDEGRDRAVRDDTIVNVHREQRRGEREHVDEQCRQRDVAVVRSKAADHRPEPVTARQIAGGDGSRIGGGNRFDEEEVARIVRGQLGKRHVLDGLRLGWIDDLRNLRDVVELPENKRYAVFHHQQSRQHQRGNVRKRTLGGLDLEPGTQAGALDK